MEMTKNTQLAAIIITGLLLVAGISGGVYVYNQKEAEIKTLMVEKNNANQIIQKKDSVVNDMENTFNEIETNLKFIKEKRNKISMIQSEGGKNRKQLIVEDVKLMDTMLEESEKKIAALEEKLKKSGMNLKSYEKRLQALSETIESQNTEIAELKKDVENKNTNIAELGTKVQNLNTDIQRQSDTISYKQKQIVDKTDKLNTAHFALGTFKELKKEGILDREGGILGVGGGKAIQGNFDSKYFTDLDIRKTKTIPLNAKKAVLISEHPSSSYKLVEENGQIAYLEIENPEEFWRISKYAVIQIK
jgi:predicted  nucleic acid-binding Zn-ribbon protein